MHTYMPPNCSKKRLSASDALLYPNHQYQELHRSKAHQEGEEIVANKRRIVHRIACSRSSTTSVRYRGAVYAPCISVSPGDHARIALFCTDDIPEGGRKGETIHNNLRRANLIDPRLGLDLDWE